MATFISNTGLVFVIFALFAATDHIAYGRGVLTVESLPKLNQRHPHAVTIFAVVAITAFFLVPLLVDKLSHNGLSLQSILSAIFFMASLKLGKELGCSNKESLTASLGVLALWWLFPGVQMISIGISLGLCIGFPLVFKSAPTAIAIIPVLVMLFVDPTSTFGTGAMEVHANSLGNTPAIISLPHDCSIMSLGALDIAFPGIMVLMAMRLGRITGRKPIGWWTMGAYFVGLALATLASQISHQPQPAMLYIVPTTILSFFWAAYFYGGLKPREIITER